MKIGITYDLRDDYLNAGYGEEETAEFDRQDTIDAIETALNDMEYETDCIGNFAALARRLLCGERWDLVFNIAEGLNGFGREALVPALLDAYRIPYTFSDPLVLALTLHKGMVKMVVRELGVPTPEFFVVDNDLSELRDDLLYPLFAKPIAEGTGKGIDGSSKIVNRAQLRDVCDHLLMKCRQPVLVETYLPGREFTVGIVGAGSGAEVLGVMEIIFRENADQGVYSYTNKEHYKDHVDYRLVDDQVAQRTQELALTVWRGLGCRDAGRIDFRTDAHGVPNFMEVNPLAGLHPEHSDLCILASLIGLPYRKLIGRILFSACERYAFAQTFRKAAHG